MDAASITILALAAILAFLPGLIDRWALQRGASPETLIGLAIVTLAGVAAVPVAFVICASRPAAARGASTATGIVAVAGLLSVDAGSGPSVDGRIRVIVATPPRFGGCDVTREAVAGTGAAG